VRGTLHNLPERAAVLDPASPVLVVIGAVVGLIDRYNWFPTAGASTASPFGAAEPPWRAMDGLNKRSA
jgi:hypothetical protein